MKKNTPLVAAVCNIVVPGLGYVIIGRRTTFGWLLLSSFLLWIVGLVFVDWSAVYPEPPLMLQLIETLAWLLVATAFGYDAFQEAKAT